MPHVLISSACGLFQMTEDKLDSELVRTRWYIPVYLIGCVWNVSLKLHSQSMWRIQQCLRRMT